MSNVATIASDVMLVCRNGHVITTRLRRSPALSVSHCDRCGGVTHSRCLTCGHELPGSPDDLEPIPIGDPMPPQYCAACGAAFPWTKKPAAPASPEVLDELCRFLRRVPAVIRELRSRHGDRQPFVIRDDYDLSDLLRALLVIRFEDVRLMNRTPAYSPVNHTDLLLHPSRISVIARLAIPNQDFLSQLEQDVAAYAWEGQSVRQLVYFVYDPERLLVQPERLERSWAAQVGPGWICPVIVS